MRSKLLILLGVTAGALTQKLTADEDCGCTYTRGYWGSKRFIGGVLRQLRDFTQDGQCFVEDGDSLADLFDKGYANNVFDTCDYPSGFGYGSVSGCGTYQVWQLFQESKPNSVNTNVWNFAKQLWAAKLNLENPDVCACDVPEDLYCDRAAFNSLIADGEAIIEDKCTANGKINFACDSPACETALQDICVYVRDVLVKIPADTDCVNNNPIDLNDALSYFNEGVIGPGHCGDISDTYRGCCGVCEQSPDKFVQNCEGGVGLAANAELQGNTVEVQGGSWTPRPGWWDIANFVMLIVAIILLAIGLFLHRSSKGYMRTKASVADALKYN